MSSLRIKVRIREERDVNWSKTRLTERREMVSFDEVRIVNQTRAIGEEKICSRTWFYFAEKVQLETF